MSRNSFFQDAVGVLVATPEIEADGAIGQYPKGGLTAGLYVDRKRREEGTMRTSLVLLFIGVLVAFGAGVLTNPTPANADNDGLATFNPGLVSLACPNVNFSIYVVHCDKILFSPEGQRLVIQCPSLVVEPYDGAAGVRPFTVSRFDKNDQLDIKVLDNPQKVADVRAKVVQFLTALTCTASDNKRQDDPIEKRDIKIIDVEYVVIPPNQFNSGTCPLCETQD